MDQVITLPVWLVALGAVLGAIALLDRLLIPSVRWAFRRRANTAIDELNTRLQLKIQPFKLTKRQVLIDRLLFDAQVVAAIEEHAQTENMPRDVALAKAKRYAREIVPSFSAYAYFRVGTRIARRVSQTLYRVRLGYANPDALKTVAPDASVVFVINHRSNMDYVLVTYMVATQSALSYAVGEWAQVWGLRSLIRSMGAYFVRRGSSNPLYRKILARYVHMATEAGVVQAMFPEGGLTRDGRLQPAKLGLLSYMVSGFDPKGARDVAFIPVGINYDRVLEDRIQLGALGADPKQGPVFRFNPWVFLAYNLNSLWLRLRGRWHRFGYACISFGEPISLRAYLARRVVDFRSLASPQREAEMERLGQTLIDAVGRVIPALPVSLVARALLDAGAAPLTLFELKGRVFALMDGLERAGAYVHIPRADRDYAIDVGLRMLKLRRLVIEENETWRANPAETALLGYYANSIAHLFPPAAVRAA